jgi:hypothetical protein
MVGFANIGVGGEIDRREGRLLALEHLARRRPRKPARNRVAPAGGSRGTRREIA